jgi:hypothetical protein
MHAVINGIKFITHLYCYKIDKKNICIFFFYQNYNKFYIEYLNNRTLVGGTKEKNMF